MFEIFEVNSRKKLKQFIDFPRRLYSEEPNYISDLDITLKSKLTAKNPFLKHSEIALFLARDVETNLVVGRIAAIHNTTHVLKYNDKSGFFGFFDSLNDSKISSMLFDKASTWLKNKGLENIIGPTNLTTNESSGLLIRGFKYPNQVNMPYNYPYYSELLESYGFSKTIDLFAYHIVGTPEFEKYTNVMRRAEQRLVQNGIEIRNMTSKSFSNDILRLNDAYNKFNEGNWGFIPLNRDEFRYMAKELKSIMPFELSLIAEIAGEIIGYVIAVPDFNQVIRKIRNGKLFPYGILKILRYRRTIDSSRVILIGIDDKYRGVGLDLILYKRITDALHRQKIFQCEAGYVMSTNNVMNSLMLKIGGKPIKQYSLYSKKVST